MFSKDGFSSSQPFPLSLPPIFESSIAADFPGSRSAKRRLQRTSHVSSIVRDSVVALNSMCAGGVPLRTNSPIVAQLDVSNSLHAWKCMARYSLEGGLREGWLCRSCRQHRPPQCWCIGAPPRWFPPVAELEKKCGRKLVEGLIHSILPDHMAAENKTKN